MDNRPAEWDNSREVALRLTRQGIGIFCVVVRIQGEIWGISTARSSEKNKSITPQHRRDRISFARADARSAAPGAMASEVQYDALNRLR